MGGGEGERSEADAAELKGLVQQRRVYFALRPTLELLNGVRRASGVDFMLWAVHGPWPDVAPGCERCVEVFEDLRRIASVVLPPASEVAPFNAALYDAPALKTDEIVLRAFLRDGRDASGGAEALVEVVNSLRSRLKRLGIFEGAYRAPERQVDEPASE